MDAGSAHKKREGATVYNNDPAKKKLCGQLQQSTVDKIIYDTGSGCSNSTQEYDVNEYIKHLSSEESLAAQSNYRHEDADQIKAKIPLLKIISVQNDADKLAEIFSVDDTNALYDKVLELRLDPNRLSLMLDGMLDSAVSGDASKSTSKGSNDHERQSSDVEGIFADIAKVQSLLEEGTAANPNEIYCLLEACLSEDRVAQVANALMCNLSGADLHLGCLKEDKPDSDNLRTFVVQPFSDDDLRNDPIFKDTEIVSKLFPTMDKNEIYAYLEAHYEKPDRVTVVVDELLRLQSSGLDSQSQDDAAALAALITTAARSESNGDCTNNVGITAELQHSDGPSFDELRQDVDYIRSVIPDVDPDYVFNELERMLSDGDRRRNLVERMLKDSSYPKLRDRLKYERDARRKARLQNLTLSHHELLQLFPEPSLEFYNEQKMVTDSYKAHAFAQLTNQFPAMHTRHIAEKLGQHNGHFTPTLRELEQEENLAPRPQGKKSRIFRCVVRRKLVPMPEEPNEYFYRELIFSKEESAVGTYLEQRNLQQQKRLSAARVSGALLECACCYDDETLAEESVACSSDHVFCAQCVRRWAECRISETHTTVPCLAPGCAAEFDCGAVCRLVSPALQAQLVGRLQQQQLRQADIAGLVTCPFCCFAVAAADELDKVFRCQNPDCLKESCRLCREPSHAPLHCDEVEKQGEVSWRTFMEQRVTEAMLHVCPSCSRQFYKTDGCNKITCPCGALICYMCRQIITGHDHFHENGCELEGPAISELHYDEVRRAATAARQVYEAEHCDMTTTLKYDPLHDPLHVAQLPPDIEDSFDSNL